MLTDTALRKLKLGAALAGDGARKAIDARRAISEGKGKTGKELHGNGMMTFAFSTSDPRLLGLLCA